MVETIDRKIPADPERRKFHLMDLRRELRRLTERGRQLERGIKSLDRESQGTGIKQVSRRRDLVTKYDRTMHTRRRCLRAISLCVNFLVDAGSEDL